jgi:hypothetical protein
MDYRVMGLFQIAILEERRTKTTSETPFRIKVLIFRRLFSG